MDFKVRCKKPIFGTHEGNIYSVIDGSLIDDDGTKRPTEGGTLKSVEDINKWWDDAEFELIPDLPHICEVLGNGKPLEEGEVFRYSDQDDLFQICSGHVLYQSSIGWVQMQHQEAFENMLNHPEKIIRTPQFSEDEKALMRLCGDNGYWQWYRDGDGMLCCKEYDEMYGPVVSCISMKEITKQYTREHPFDAASYLEAQK
jgi:hypothetical protein